MSTLLAEQLVTTLTVAEMQTLIRETVEEVLQQMLGDPDAGLELHPGFEARLQNSVEYVQSGGRVLALKELIAELEDE